MLVKFKLSRFLYSKQIVWDFSALLVAHGFKVISLSKSTVFAESTFPLSEESGKLAVRAIAKGLPDIDEFVYNNRKCRAITVGDKIYGQYIN